MSMMLRFLIWFTARASAMKRDTIWGFDEYCLCSTLIAAALPMSGCTARYTAPNPPSPSFPSTRYSPAVWPGWSCASAAATASSGSSASPSEEQVFTSSEYRVRHVGQVAIRQSWGGPRAAPTGDYTKPRGGAALTPGPLSRSGRGGGRREQLDADAAELPPS